MRARSVSKSLTRPGLHEFTSGPLNAPAAESYLRRALEALMDLGRHILAKGFGRGVAEYKKIDPLLIVFLSFVNEGLFDAEACWQSDLHDDELWLQVQELCNCSVAIEDLGFDDPEDGKIEGGEVLEDIIREGAEMNLELKAIEQELIAEAGEGDSIEVVDIDAQYSPYFEPDYVAPVWRASRSL